MKGDERRRTRRRKGEEESGWRMEEMEEGLGRESKGKVEEERRRKGRGR